MNDRMSDRMNSTTSAHAIPISDTSRTAQPLYPNGLRLAAEMHLEGTRCALHCVLSPALLDSPQPPSSPWRLGSGPTRQCSPLFSVIDGVLLKPLRYRQPDRLISLHLRITTLKNLDVLPQPPFIYNLWRDNSRVLENIAIIHPGDENLTGTGQPERLLSARVSASLFPTLGIEPARGRAFAANEDA